MSRRKTTILHDMVVLSIILVCLVGIENTGTIIYQFMKGINSVLVQILNNSILSFLLKYLITFPIVGIILSYVGSPRGKVGHYFGKILYFIIGYFVCTILDLIAGYLF